MINQMEGNAVFSEIFLNHKEYASDKWEHYLTIYEAEIGPFVREGRPINLLEIGVQNGGSLQIWSKYLPRGSKIIGIDINEKGRNLIFPDGVTFIHGSAADPKIVDILPEVLFDIIIDDGSHIPTEVMSTFPNLFGKLAPGGKYIIEDVETSYDSHYGGGFRSGQSSVEWAKGFVDALNVDHISANDRLMTADGRDLEYIGALMWKVSFYDSVIVFQKLQAPKKRPFRRLFAGEVTDIMDPLEWITHVSPEVFSTIGFSEGMHMRISAELVDRVQQLLDSKSKISKELSDLKTNIARLLEI